MNLLILGKGGESQNLLISYFYGSHSIVSAVEGASVWRTFCFRLRKRGIYKTLNQYLFTLLVKFQGFYLKKSQVIFEDVKTVEMVSLNSCDLFVLIEKVRPDYIVLAGASVLRLKFVPDGYKDKILNIHLGITPAFRGVYGGFWSIYTGRSDLYGTTLHFVDAGIDTGEIIGQTIVEPISFLNIYKQNRQLYNVGYQLLDEFLRNERRSGSISSDATINKLWSHPTIGQFFKLLIKVKCKTII